MGPALLPVVERSETSVSFASTIVDRKQVYRHRAQCHRQISIALRSRSWYTSTHVGKFAESLVGMMSIGR